MFPMKTVRAFSLVEMAMVLLALTLVLGSLLIPLAERTHQQRMVATRKTLEEIKEALTGFAIINKRLPCPSSNTNEGIEKGIEDSNLCSKEGYLPWRILGVGRYDEWGRPFRYRVDGNYTTQVSTTSNKLRIRTIRLKSDIDDEDSWLTNKGTTSDTRVVAIIFSCGKNGLPDPTLPNSPNMEINYKNDGNDYFYTNDKDGTRNTNATCENSATSWKQSDVYIYDSYQENVYDDVVTWLSKNTLMYRLIAAGQWPP